MREHPLLSDVAVAARDRKPGDRQLVAYVVPRPGDTPTAAELRRFLVDRLPEFMVPAAYVTLAALPTTASDKIDRNALPAHQLGLDG